MLSIEFVTDLGAKVTVSFERAEQLLDVQRQYGKLGWVSGDLPSGGYQFPLENEHDFDWALIGARPFTNDDGEACVWCRGAVWKRRELEAVQTKKITLPAAVKYSRGAKPTDPAHIREKGDGDIEYVALAMFRGGKRQDRYAVPSQATTQRAKPNLNIPDMMYAFEANGGRGRLLDAIKGLSTTDIDTMHAEAISALLAVGVTADSSGVAAELWGRKKSYVIILAGALGVLK